MKSQGAGGVERTLDPRLPTLWLAVVAGPLGCLQDSEGPSCGSTFLLHHSSCAEGFKGWNLLSGEDAIPITFALGQGRWRGDLAATGSLLNSSPQSQQQRRGGGEERMKRGTAWMRTPPSRTGDHPRPSGVVWTTSGWPSSLLGPSLRLIIRQQVGGQERYHLLSPPGPAACRILSLDPPGGCPGLSESKR